MCTVCAVCPNCGNQNLDADEASCVTLDGATTRVYVCWECQATVTVVIPAR